MRRLKVLPAPAPDIRACATAPKMFSPEAVKKADAQLENLRSLKHWQVIIETVESISGGRTIDQAVLENAKELQVHGLYVLIDKKDKKLRVEPSNTARKVSPRRPTARSSTRSPPPSRRRTLTRACSMPSL